MKCSPGLESSLGGRPAFGEREGSSAPRAGSAHREGASRGYRLRGHRRGKEDLTGGRRDVSGGSRDAQPGALRQGAPGKPAEDVAELGEVAGTARLMHEAGETRKRPRGGTVRDLPRVGNGHRQPAAAQVALGGGDQAGGIDEPSPPAAGRGPRRAPPRG